MASPSRNPLPFHYGWLLVSAGTVVIFGCLGLGRFALGVMLPAMARRLPLDYSQMGLLSTANFVGYLAAVLGAGVLTMRWGARIVIVVALALIGLSMYLIAKSSSFATICALLALTGIGSGLANVPLMALVSCWFARPVRGKAAGIMVIGSGFAIIFTGAVIPGMNAATPDGWRTSWLVLGSVVAGIAAVAAVILRNRPEELGLAPAGSAAADQQPMRHTPSGPAPDRARILRTLGLLYFLFGFTYSIYVTFIVTFMVDELGLSEGSAGVFWSSVGALSLLSGPVFGMLSDRIGRGAGLATVFSLQTAAYLLAAPGHAGLPLFASVACFGIVAWSVPGIMTAAVSDVVGAQDAARTFGRITFLLGIGQILGPALAGILAQKTGSFSTSFVLAAAGSSLAVALAARMSRL